MERKNSGVAVETGETVDSPAGLTEVVWCDHLEIHKNVIVISNTPNLFIVSSKFYLVAEQGKVKLLCPDCFVKGFISLSKASLPH